MPSITIKPACLLVDDTPQITVTGLRPYQKVTLASHLPNGALSYLAYAHYVTTEAGGLTNTHSKSQSGTFTGIEPAGLFWSAHAVGDIHRRLRLRITDVTTPLQTTIYVLDGHVDVTTPPDSDSARVGDGDGDGDGAVMLCSCTLDRLYMAKHVIREPVRVGKLRGTLFIPNNGVGRSAGVLDLFGSTGGISEYRASLLASRGFCAFSLAYFDYEDLQENPSPLDLEYFVEGINYLSAHPAVDPAHIGIVGVSQGGNIALYTSIYSHKVKAVVAIGPFHANVQSVYTYRDRIVDVALGNYDNIKDEEENEKNYGAVYFNPDTLKDYELPIEKSQNASFLLISGSADKKTDCRCTALLVKRLKDHNRSNFEVHMYEGAGHLIEPPHSPLCRASYHKLFGHVIQWGGDVKGHAYAQEDHWRHLLRFLSVKLNCSVIIPSPFQSYSQL